MLLRHFLKQLVRVGTLRVVDANGRAYRFGEGGGRFLAIRLHDRKLHYKLFFHPS